MRTLVPTVLVGLVIVVAFAGRAEAGERLQGVEARPRQMPPIGSDDDGRVVVEVDCKKGQRIGDALVKPARDLVVRVRGICSEEVEIRRDNVTLVGSDRALDGIRATAGMPVLSVLGATNVTLENLKIAGPSGGLLVAEGSDEVRFVGCDLVGTRARVTQSSSVTMADSNPESVYLDLGARLDCTRCSMSAASVSDGAMVFLRDCLVAHPYGIGVVIGALRGTVVAQSSRFVGYIGADDSSITLEDAEVSFGVTLARDSHLELRGTHNEIDGEVDVRAFSTVWIEPGSSVRADIRCDEGGNVSCENVFVDGAVEGCSLCDPETAP